MTGEQPRPAAAGKLKDRPVPRLIQQIFRKRITGSLVITDDAGDVTRLFVREGLPVHAERPNDIDRLDKLLVGAGLVSEAAIAEADQEVDRTGRRLGEVLVMRGKITREALAELLKTQIRRKITRVFFARGGEFAIYTEPHHFGAGDEYDLMRIDPRAILYPGIRAAYDDQRLTQELAPLAGYSFRLINLPPGFLAGMGFAAQDPTIAALRDRVLTLDELPNLGGKPSEARAAVLALLYSDLLEAKPLAGRVAEAAPRPVGDPGSGVVATAPERPTTPPQLPTATEVVAPPPPRPVAAAPRPAPPAKAAGPEPLRATIVDLNARLDQMSHFELLGVAESASPGDVNAAYMKAVRQYHPDRLAAAGLREIAPLAERVMARMGEAAAVLTDPRRRSDYVQSRGGKPTDAIGAAMMLIEAEKAFQRGEALLKKGDHANAIAAFAEAMKHAPDERHYAAHHAWARFDDPKARKELFARESLAVLEEAVKDRPHFARAYYWIGQIQKFLNAPDRAERAFREAMKIDASIIEAEREMRLLEMRRQKAGGKATAGPGTASAAKPGGLKKLFGKD